MIHQLLLGNKAETIELAFGFPSGNSAEPVQLQRVAKGMILADSDVESLTREMVQRGVLLAMARAVGAPDDTAKASDLFKAGDVKVPRSTFLAAMGNSLYEQAQLYSSTKLDDPTKLKMFNTMASDALKGVPETKQTKDLNAKIQKAMLKK